MTRVWFAIKRSPHCKSEASKVYEPARKGHRNSTRKRTSMAWRSRCSRSIANLKDIIHVSHRPPDPLPTSSCSPRSIGSSDLVNPWTHEVVACGSGNELKITAGPGSGGFGSYGCGGVPLVDPAFMRCGGDGIRNFFSLGEEGGVACSRRKNGDSWAALEGRGVYEAYEIGDIGSYGVLACYYCGGNFKKWQALEYHLVCNHAVTEVEEGESSRIVEKICQASFSDPNISRLRIEKILKVHNMQTTLARFEEYRESVKTRASKLQKKHARCIADGNELLRFHGTTITCSLGVNGSSILCSSENCNVCQIIKHGFSAKRVMMEGVVVFTALTSKRAFESIGTSKNNPFSKKALLVCRVIAGRIHKPLVLA